MRTDAFAGAPPLVKPMNEMTIDEAIAMIENDMKLHHDYLSGKYRQALKMAVDALKTIRLVTAATASPVVTFELQQGDTDNG